MSAKIGMKFTNSTNRSIGLPNFNTNKLTKIQSQKSVEKSVEKSVQKIIQANSFALYHAPMQNVSFYKKSVKGGCGCG